jgi:hypothetical protein
VLYAVQLQIRHVEREQRAIGDRLGRELCCALDDLANRVFFLHTNALIDGNGHSYLCRYRGRANDVVERR